MSWELMSYGELMSGGTNVLDSLRLTHICLSSCSDSSWGGHKVLNLAPVLAFHPWVRKERELKDNVEVLVSLFAVLSGPGVLFCGSINDVG